MMKLSWVSVLCYMFSSGLVQGGVSATTSVLLSDGLALRGCTGQVGSVDQGRTWTFELTQESQVGTYVLPEGTRFSLLPCRALEALVSHQQDPQAGYLLWARVTRYRGQNYLFLTYFQPLRATPPAEEETPVAVSPEAAAEAAARRLEINADIIAEMHKHRQLARQEATAKTISWGQNRLLLHRQGVLQHRDRIAYLALDGWGRNLSRPEYRLLPSAALAEIEQIQEQQADSVHFRVAGITTVYQGQPYLLLQRAVRVYGYGNFK